nr:DnaB-like helicase C-terminal domain-containing protein [Oceanobacillus arenosus]
MELNIPILLISQLSRSVESRQSKHPMMSDLRESGYIQQDANVIFLLYWKDYYDKQTEKQNMWR